MSLLFLPPDGALYAIPPAPPLHSLLQGMLFECTKVCCLGRSAHLETGPVPANVKHVPGSVLLWRN